MNLFCLIFGHRPKHPKLRRCCCRKWCDFKFLGYCEHKWVYELYETSQVKYIYDNDPYAPYPILDGPKEGYGPWNTTYYSNLKCDKCGVRQFSMDYEKYLTGEWT